MIRITADHITDESRGEESRVGWLIGHRPLTGQQRHIMSITGESDAIPSEGEEIKFKLYDDDGELHFEGTLHDDPDDLNQLAALSFGEADTGCTRVEVLRDGKWVVEIA